MNIILFGPPGAGKGTQAQNIVKKFNLIQISTGDLLRNEIKNKTDIGKEIEDTISKGDFATDEIIDRLLEDKVTNTVVFSQAACTQGSARKSLRVKHVLEESDRHKYG